MDISHYIQGQALQQSDEDRIALTNPADETPLGHVAIANQKTVAEAVAAAKAAFPAWAATSAVKRARVLFKLKELIELHTDLLAQLVTAEHGKTIADAKGSIARGLEVLEYCCGMPHLLKGSHSTDVATGIDCTTLRQPLGVCVGVSPFNFPVMIPMWLMIPAIACGNTFVLKPSERDPSAPYKLAELLTYAGLPDGVVNVVNGDKTSVEHLITHPDVTAVSAVGSTPAAQHIYQTAIQHGKRAQCFGGAKNHCVIMPDADLAHVADALLGAAFGSAGERCMAISVAVIIGKKTADEIIKRLAKKIPQLSIGAGTEEVAMGPLVTAEHLARVKNYLDIGVKEGAKLIVDGRQVKLPDTGFFLGGSLFDEVKPSMQIYQQEIFGPVLCVVRVDDLAQAIQLINDNAYGNGTSIFTQNGAAARQFVQHIQVGMVGINVAIPVPVAYHSFGGWKQSMFGDVRLHGDESIHFYTKAKTITSRWPAPATRPTEFSG